ncbi:MAG: hypothetical protein ACR2QK_02255 [Acidimicrobiales bacterium]
MSGELAWPQVGLRSPDEVMQLDRMGAFFPTRLSFMRSLIRDLDADGCQVTRPVWEIDDDGYGRAVYAVDFGGHTYSLVAFSTPLAPEDRTDRVIAQAWDSSYVLFDGVPGPAEIDRLADAAPRQEAARFEPVDLILSRANRSVRLFDHVIEQLALGHQPDPDMIRSIGYLMRTTAVYANGKFGIADRNRYADRPLMDHPFRAEMLTVWLIRGFTMDLVEHIAARRSPAAAVTLERRLRRYLGIGNATGLGMAPFLISHPILINNWMLVRETALARVRALPAADPGSRQRFRQLAARVGLHLDQWQVEDERQASRIDVLRREWADLQELIGDRWWDEPRPWDRLVELSQDRSLECQELVVAAVLEPHPDVVDGLTSCMTSGVEPTLAPAMTLDELRRLIEAQWDWAIALDFDDPSEAARFWYVSEDNLEPRLGNRHLDDGAELEEPLDVARRVKALHQDLLHRPRPTAGSEPLATFLLAKPHHRYAARRVQTLADHPYSEIRANLIGERCLPIDMLRAKLSLFGAAKFDPKSDLWTRVALYQGAPLADEVGAAARSGADSGGRRPGFDCDDWWLPVLEPR